MDGCWSTFLFLIIILRVESQERLEYCKTHDSKPGSCMRMRDCERLGQLSTKFKNRLEASSYLRKSGCGIDKYGPLFCCPSTASRNTKRMVFNVIEKTRDSSQLMKNENRQSIDFLIDGPTGSTGRKVQMARAATSTSDINNLDPWPIFVEWSYRSRVGMFKPRFNQSINYPLIPPNIGIRCYYHPNPLYPFQISRKNYHCICYRIKPPVTPPVTPTVPDNSYSSTTTAPSNTPDLSSLSTTTELSISSEMTDHPTYSSTTTENVYFPSTSITTESPHSTETPYPSTNYETTYPSSTTGTADNSSTEKPCSCSNSSTTEKQSYTTVTTTVEPNYPQTTEEDSSKISTVPTSTVPTSTVPTTTVPTTTTEDPGYYRNVLPTPPRCGQSKSIVNRVVGGVPSTIGKWPWMVALGYKSTRDPDGELSWSCGGALVTHRHILTAAHCLDPYTNGYILHTARMGVVDLDTDKSQKAVPVDVPVANYIGHKNFTNNPPYLHDIAIVVLKTLVEFDNRIQPICLPLSSAWKNEQLEGKHPIIAGWGSLESRGIKSRQLMEAQIPFVSHETCEESYRSQFNLSQQQLCAGNKEKDSCQGDSGGPLMFPKNGSYFVIGIVSFGKGCAAPGYPGIYTRVTAYIDWIKNTLSAI